MKDRSVKILSIAAILVMLSIAVVAAGCTTQSSTPTPTAAPSAIAQTQNQSKVIVDFAGNSVTVPGNISRITSIHPIPTALLARLSPQDMTSIDKVFAGRLPNATWTASDLAYLHSLPVIPAMPQNPTKEQILSTNPQVAFLSSNYLRIT
jgi:iron complex transport system substrate-binding protein